MSTRDVSDLFLLASIFVGVLCGINGECYKGWIRFEESCYMFSNSYTSWILADANCMSHQSRLAEVYSQNQSDFLNEKVKNLGHHYWLGARDDVIDGEWQWGSSGEYLSFTHWAPGFPNSYEKRCLTIDDHHQYKWDDSACEASKRYICERVTSSGDCTRGWFLFGNTCYFISDSYETWSLAQGSCKAHRGRLTEVYYDSLNNFLIDTLKNRSLHHDYWIGGRADPTTFVWQWSSTGQPFTFTNWAPHRPDKPVTKDCLLIYDRWEDAPCDHEHHYICEKRYEESEQILG